MALLLCGRCIRTECRESATGGIRGQVADPTGAVIPGATVVATTTSGKVAGKATSDGLGAYAIHGLAPGTYSMTATANGFAAFAAPGIVVAAGQMRTTVNANLDRSRCSSSRCRCRRKPTP